jgi:hypothetical protein
LSVVRSVVLGAARRLSVFAPISRRASGRVSVQFVAAGQRLRFSAPIVAGRIRFSRALSRAQARLGTGILTIGYAGDGDTRPQQVRLRAASGRAGLALSRPRIVDGRLRASGTVTSLARGVVRVQVQFVVGAQTRTLQMSAPISGGRWALDEALSAGVRDAIARRTGSVHSYSLFTGYLPLGIRGEMRSYQILGDR